MSGKESDLQNWDPMRDAYCDPNFNAYREGPGTNFEVTRNSLVGRSGRKEMSGPFKLFVGNIPIHIDSEGMGNVFGNFGRPFDVYRNVPSPGMPRTWGFVYYQTYQEAECAIRELNGRGPLHLKVEFARNAETEKERIRYQSDNDLPLEKENNEKNSLPPLLRAKGRGRGLLRSSPSVQRVGNSLQTKDADADEDLSHFCTYKGSRFDETNAITMRGLRKSVNGPFGPRTVAMGRAFFDRGHDTSVCQGNNFQDKPDHISKVQSLIEIDYAVREKERLKFSEKQYPKSAIKGVCSVCLAVASLYCQRCKEWYCSRTCQEGDWEKHQLKCKEIVKGREMPESAESSPNISQNNEATPKANTFKPVKKSPKNLSNKVKTITEKTKNKKFENKGSNVNDSNKNTFKNKKESIKNSERKSLNDSSSPSDSEDARARRTSVMNSAEKRNSNAHAHAQKPSIDDVEEIPSDDFIQVKVVIPVNSTDYWVLLSENEHKVLEMSSDLRDCAEPKIHKPEIGCYCIAKYENIWFRAKVTSALPNLKVFYIDFGNEESCDLNSLKCLPEYARHLRAQGIKIRLAPGTSSVHENLLEESILLVKSIGKDFDGTILVHVKGEKYESVDKKHEDKLDQHSIPIQSVVVLLKPGMTGILNVQECDTNQDFTATMICQSFLDQYSTLISGEFGEEGEKSSSKYKPRIREIVLAQSPSEHIWVRAFVLAEDNGHYIVACCDTGLVESVQCVKRLPKKYKEVVLFSVRCSIVDFIRAKHSNIIDVKRKFSFEVESVDSKGACLKIKDTDPDRENEDINVNITKWLPPFDLFEPLKCIELKNGPCVMTSYASSKNIYIRPLTPEVTESYNRILQDVSGHSFTALPLCRSPKVGELLSCKFSEDGNFYRAKVKNINEEGVLVTYVDFGNTERISSKNFKTLPNELKEHACLTVKVTLKNVEERPLTKEALNFFTELCGNEMELRVEIHESRGNLVDLYTSDGTSVNKKLDKLLEPAWKKCLADGDGYKHQIFTYADAPVYELKIGATVEFMMNTTICHNAIMATPVNSLIVKALDAHLRSDIAEYCERSKEKSYVPRLDELCLVKYRGEWSRASCMGTDGGITLILLDVGDVVKLPHTDVRRITKDFAVIPPAALYLEVKIEGKYRTADIQDTTKEYFRIMRKIQVEILKRSKQGYIVSIPALNQHLREVFKTK